MYSPSENIDDETYKRYQEDYLYYGIKSTNTNKDFKYELKEKLKEKLRDNNYSETISSISDGFSYLSDNYTVSYGIL